MRAGLILIFLHLMFGTVVAAGHSAGAQGQAIPRVAPTAIHGVWRQADDGRFLRISADAVDVYHASNLQASNLQATKRICYRETPGSGLPLSESYELFSLQDDGQTLWLWRNDFGDRFDGFYREEFQRVDALPAGTVEVPETDGRFADPQFVFDFVCAQFDEHFPHFERRGFDWEARKSAHGEKIRPEMTRAELYETICQMLAGLGDSHTRLYWDQREQPFKTGHALALDGLDLAFSQQSEFTEKREFIRDWARRMKASIEPHLDSPLQTAANGRFRWGILQGNIGYIENEFIYGFSPAGTPRSEEIAILERELDAVMQGLKDCDALILDLTFNGGGYDAASMIIASRFADQRRHVMSFDAAGRKAEPRKCYVSPGGDFQFTRPVFVLTSNSTVSSAEALVLALRAFPHITQVGEPTRGCLSSFLNKWMPGGFHLTLSNEIWSGPDGHVYEGAGIAPDVRFDVLSTQNILHSYPAALKKTIDLARASGD